MCIFVKLFLEPYAATGVLSCTCCVSNLFNIMRMCASWPMNLRQRMWWFSPLVTTLADGGGIICNYLLWDHLDFDILGYDSCACASFDIFFVYGGGAAVVVFFIYGHINTCFNSSVPYSYGDLTGGLPRVRDGLMTRNISLSPPCFWS